MSSTRSVVTVSARPLFRHWAKPVVVAIRTRNGVLDVVGIDPADSVPGRGGARGRLVMEQR